MKVNIDYCHPSNSLHLFGTGRDLHSPFSLPQKPGEPWAYQASDYLWLLTFHGASLLLPTFCLLKVNSVVCSMAAEGTWESFIKVHIPVSPPKMQRVIGQAVGWTCGLHPHFLPISSQSTGLLGDWGQSAVVSLPPSPFSSCSCPPSHCE